MTSRAELQKPVSMESKRRPELRTRFASSLDLESPEFILGEFVFQPDQVQKAESRAREVIHETGAQSPPKKGREECLLPFLQGMS